MIKLNDIEQFLRVSFDDFKLSKPEKYSLQQLVEDIKSDPTHLNFVRNKAFEVVREDYLSVEPHYLDALKWLENVIKVLDLAQADHTPVNSQALFSPGANPVKKIRSLIKHAKHRIDVCVFTISDDSISDSLIAAYERGIDIRIVTDNDKAEDMGSDIYRMAKHGMEIKIDRSANHMHHKFAIVDNRHLINGSFNWTRSATKYNQENVVVTNDSRLIKDFSLIFEKLWKHCANV